jgi:hypothetical protein
MSSAAHVDRRCFFVSSATSCRASIRAHGVWAVSYTLVMWAPFLVQEFLAGKKPVDHEVECLVQSVQEVDLALAVMPVVSHELADDGVVLFFHMRVVVPLVRTGTGEGNILSMAEAGEMSVHELAPVVRMQGEGVSRGTGGDRTPVQRPQTLLRLCVRPPPRSTRWCSR